MGAARWRLTVDGAFSASHQLRCYDGKCERLHGHNFGVRAVVEGEKLSHDTEILMDFKELKTLLKKVLADLDHCHLNEFEPFLAANPSSENIARYIYMSLARLLAEHEQGAHVRLVEIGVSEKDSSEAVYMEL
jgi:6-pyruvoyltetrahydropterin/6-carboxytetrahydropterin synthase